MSDMGRKKIGGPQWIPGKAECPWCGKQVSRRVEWFDLLGEYRLIFSCHGDNDHQRLEKDPHYHGGCDSCFSNGRGFEPGIRGWPISNGRAEALLHLRWIHHNMDPYAMCYASPFARKKRIMTEDKKPVLTLDPRIQPGIELDVTVTGKVVDCTEDYIEVMPTPGGGMNGEAVGETLRIPLQSICRTEVALPELPDGWSWGRSELDGAMMAIYTDARGVDVIRALMSEGQVHVTADLKVFTMPQEVLDALKEVAG